MNKELQYEGKSYKLCDQTPEEEVISVCAGCAFSAVNPYALCGMGDITDLACCRAMGKKVWRLC